MKCNFKYILIVLASFYILPVRLENQLDDLIPKYKHNDSKLNKPDGMLLFKNSLSICPLYNSDCKFSILVKKSIDFKRMKIESSNSEYAVVKHFEICNTSFLSRPCPKINEFIDTALDISPEYDILTVILDTILVGKTFIKFEVSNYNESIEYEFYVVQPERLVDKAFNIYIWVFQLLISLIMGILIDTNALLKLVKMPIPVLIGFCCQYCIMPLLATAFNFIFKMPPVEALALFIYGCSPGGSQSNNWTILFDGDIDLSVIMTFFSTVASLFMMPLWIYTLGTIYTNEANIQLPFVRLAINIGLTIVPCLIGIALSFISPKVKIITMKYSKKLITFKIITLLSGLFGTKYYIFKMLTKIDVLTVIIPWTGFILSALAAYIFRLPRSQILTISVETGMQNMGITFLIILYNFPTPESDYAFLPLMGIALFISIPFYFGLLFKAIAKKIKSHREKKNFEGVPLDDIPNDQKLIQRL